MNQLSDEQQYIVDTFIHKKKNVIVNAVAGTGKTTTILSLAKLLENKKKILQITYNTDLRTDVENKVNEYELTNIVIHTFHSLAVRYYDPAAFTDTELRRILYHKLKPIVEIDLFDVIVIDECQDMTLLLFQFLVLFLTDINYPFQLLILGDDRQCLYDFKGADRRFLTMAQEIWQDFPLLKTHEFEKCTMRMSYRITNQICNFVNDVMLGEERMLACRDDEKVIYRRYSSNNIHTIVCAEIEKLFETGAKPSDIFILSASTKGTNSNIRLLENRMVEKGIPCYISNTENDKGDERVTDNKVVFSTYHSAKGRQRKYVFIIGFDDSYMKYYAKNLPTDKCPNTLYVAATRAINRLYLMDINQSKGDRPLKFLKKNLYEMNQCQDYIDFKGDLQTIFADADDKLENTNKKLYTPTKLIKFIPEQILDLLTPIIDRIFVKETFEDTYGTIEIPNVIETVDGYFEEVSELNGIAIPSMYCDTLLDTYDTGNKTNRCLLELIETNMQKMNSKDLHYFEKMVPELPTQCETIQDYLYLSNVYSTIQEGLYFKIKQIDIDDYTWLNEDTMNQCMERFTSVITNDCKQYKPLVEETIIQDNDDLHIDIDNYLKPLFENTLFRFTAKVDLITDSTLWELKCTNTLTIDHKLQLVLYVWLMKMRTLKEKPDNRPVPTVYKLFNIKSGELFTLNASLEELHSIIVLLLQGKDQQYVTLTDEEFVNTCKIK